jgi:hypothetical protein
VEKSQPKPSRKTRLLRSDTWPSLLQVAGLVAVCFGVGMLAGLAWALVAGGASAVVVGAANEA